MANQEEDIHHQNQQSWGTWEELLLASAVKRHGFKNWDSVALELQTKTCLPHLLTTAQICQQKYLDLNRRFNTTTINNLHHNHTPEEDNQDEEQNNINTGIINNNIISVPWLEELRKLRVAELKQEVQRYDVSILTLQLKVKKLEEERERSVQEGDGNTEKPDLMPDKLRKEDEPGKPGSVSGEESDREDRSVNESNSTASGGVEDAVAKLEEVSVTGGEETVAVKSEPVVGFLDMIRAHRNGSLFESLLESQEMGVYKDMIRQHMDLEAIQAKLEQGSYSPSNLLFFRDLLLLFNNALVFFPKHSVESLTAHKIRSLVMDEMRKDTQKSESTVVPENIPAQPKRELERSDSLLAKHKSSIPVIVCRKRSSISAKPSSSSLGQKIEQQQQQSNENKPVNDPKPPAVEQGLLKMKSEEKPVTGARSTRRGNKNLAKGSTSPSKKQNTSPDTKVAAPDKSETPKTEKKKNEALPLEKKKSAVDFLKRIKKNSPAETPKNNSRGASSGGERKMEGSGGKGERGKERVLKNSDKKQGKQESSSSKKNVGRPSKKAAEESRVSGKRGRDSGGKEVAKRPRKRSRR
uniref:Muscle M-line assembly protein unc-89-like isoform X2 n=1 Tax=Populus alba TaxID=43335 RepID=A0A4U5MAG8_POPAL|nr:muscle M-line assembly protein unc-89-like isoform X2 [Populus alba]